MYILLAGLSHKTAPVELREKIALSGKALERFYQDIEEEPALEGTVVLSTCNGRGLYHHQGPTGKALRTWWPSVWRWMTNTWTRSYMPSCYQAVEHLFRVAWA